MKAGQLIKQLETLPPDTPVFSLVYMPEDAEMFADSALTNKEWLNVVEKMFNNDHIDDEVFAQFREYVTEQLDKRDNKNANK